MIINVVLSISEFQHFPYRDNLQHPENAPPEDDDTGEANGRFFQYLFVHQNLAHENSYENPIQRPEAATLNQIRIWVVAMSLSAHGLISE